MNQRLRALADSAEQLRQEIRAANEALADLATRLDIVQWQAERVAAQRSGDRDVAARMDRLEHVLDLDRAATHLREVVRRTELVADPVPHAIISDAFPADIYQAAIDAIPPPLFFEHRAGRRELPVPPTLAPTYSIVTWAFVADVVKEVLAPALVECFREPLDRHVRTLCPSVPEFNDSAIVLTVSRGRIALRRPGDVSRPDRCGPWDWLTVVLDLARAEDHEDYGSSLRAFDAIRPVPFRANSALAFIDSTAAHEYVSIPDDAAAQIERYTCEFRLGPDKKTRRLLDAQMDEPTR